MNSHHLTKDVIPSGLPHACQYGSVIVNRTIRCTLGCLLEYFQKVGCTARTAWLRVTWVPCLCPDGRVNTAYPNPGYAPVLHSCLDILLLEQNSNHFACIGIFLRA